MVRLLGVPARPELPAGRTGIIALLAVRAQRVGDACGVRLLSPRPLIWINGIGGHLARNHALGEIGAVALQALQRVGGFGAVLPLQADIISLILDTLGLAAR